LPGSAESLITGSVNRLIGYLSVKFLPIIMKISRCMSKL